MNVDATLTYITLLRVVYYYVYLEPDPQWLILHDREVCVMPERRVSAC